MPIATLEIKDGMEAEGEMVESCGVGLFGPNSEHVVVQLNGELYVLELSWAIAFQKQLQSRIDICKRLHQEREPQNADQL